ncbi:LutB/LldF family L-lactate oxidation iron-sulfur protein [Trinickia caryophylli]|uniref:L-lactate dehydrogenase complex protein LldF n=1 Tax=Trinickia caryophylli TaxID=28094 RepID=A0A1X7FSP7_TRICW|nr:LutB/LldF family L-lactate oxidation iron-sulfur protein [Trinickia caryophylli]PMS11940.1 iron-sulfur cluster-binding protein [Trinickia caryophylli]TRX13983.1 iron-sulfur cluster-binding protein [Trinickia caryophylli]WQE15581.1 LutB/LldF family L-lactate oxidation iron-sulfur protein [Trinickia caryophylli]SMF58118.1 L-lactate dehydrogenase complex protein LldF [Trinickia caryophylli]GLU33662.1 iron-sulfur cluster-binding protein [Trinickia caryophylli]
MNDTPMQFVPPADFKARAREALADPLLRQSFRGAMDFLQSKRATQFPDQDELEALRDVGEAIRQHALGRLPDLLTALEAKLTAAGVQVHWAETAEEGNEIIHGIAAAHRAHKVIKGKSMASEEMELNHYLAERGIDCLESDMGEYIVQLAGEKPSHIVMPAIHKTRGQIARLFEENIPDAPYTEDVDELIQMGRHALRHAFVDADIGISGVNFAAADTGTLWLVENEGNGRLSTTVPPVHIAIMGIEKVVAKLEHIVPLSSLLTRSATGQPITTYFNLISGPRRADELDGPRELHLVLLDNGRTQAYADEQLRATLQCIRCGACMNHCPVYTRIGGQAYGTTYPGPIGKIISPHLLGLEATADLPTASSLCGACGEVCPVRIPIPQLLVRLRTEANRSPDEAVAHPLRGQGANYNRREHIVWRFWSGAFAHPRAYRVFRWFATRFRKWAPRRQMGWTQHRVPLTPAARSLSELLRERGQPE